jgi:hypothetical protein
VTTSSCARTGAAQRRPTIALFTPVDVMDISTYLLV